MIISNTFTTQQSVIMCYATDQDPASLSHILQNLSSH